jgi:RNA polymerase sigma factor (sigma-70 family)
MSTASTWDGSLLRKQLPLVRRRLLQRGRVNQTEVDEAIQDGFLRLCCYRLHHEVRDLVGFLILSAERTQIDHLRHERHTRRLFIGKPVHEMQLLDQGATPDEDYLGRQTVLRIERCLEGVNPRTREAFLLHRFEGLSCAQIAKELRISSRAVSNHIAKALMLIDEALRRETP